MTVRVLKGASTPGPQMIPPHLQRILMPHLSVTSPCEGKCVKGKVVQKCPLIALDGDDYILKAVMEEHEQQDLPAGPSSINVILFGALAKEFSENVNLEDVLVVAGFTVGRSPTAAKDGLHPCNLQLAGEEACVYVYPAADPLASTSSNSVQSAVTGNKTLKYTYVTLNHLKPGVVVNIYGVVTFFKQPFRTKGTDYCSTLKVTDQSNMKIGCSIFSEKLEEHPKIYKIGDIVRLHRVKTQLFNDSINVITSSGFSALVFDGTVGSPLVPRTSNRTFHFTDEDRRTVEGLRLWASGHSLLPTATEVRLSDVHPQTYFDLTCQLLAKAKMDKSCTLLKVWDGTMCPHPLLSMSLEPDALEGSMTATRGRENLIANVLVYDNHVEVAAGLKPGAFLRIYNLHAILQSTATAPPGGQPGHLCFHLHGGTSYGRGICVLPQDTPDLQTLKGTLESLSAPPELAVNDGSILEVWSTPPESLDGGTKDDVTARTCDHVLDEVFFSCVKSSKPPRSFHVRAQLRSYRPERLHQSLKLHCPQCRALQDIPGDEAIARVFEETLSRVSPCRETWVLSELVDSTQPGRKIGVHLVSGSKKGEELILLQGATLDEVCRLSGNNRSTVPVRSSQGRLTLLDLSAPFLFRDGARHYGCKQCSSVRQVEPISVNTVGWDTEEIAEALGVRLLRYVFVMKLVLEDRSGPLEAWLWKDAENFFGVSPSNVAANQEQQDMIQQTMDKLCPPGSSMAERPWLKLCLRAYTVEEEDGRSTVCYQIFDTVARCCWE